MDRPVAIVNFRQLKYLRRRRASPGITRRPFISLYPKLRAPRREPSADLKLKLLTDAVSCLHRAVIHFSKGREHLLKIVKHTRRTRACRANRDESASVVRIPALSRVGVNCDKKLARVICYRR